MSFSQSLTSASNAKATESPKATAQTASTGTGDQTRIVLEQLAESDRALRETEKKIAAKLKADTDAALLAAAAVAMVNAAQQVATAADIREEALAEVDPDRARRLDDLAKKEDEKAVQAVKVFAAKVDEQRKRQEDDAFARQAFEEAAARDAQARMRENLYVEAPLVHRAAENSPPPIAATPDELTKKINQQRTAQQPSPPQLVADAELKENRAPTPTSAQQGGGATALTTLRRRSRASAELDPLLAKEDDAAAALFLSPPSHNRESAPSLDRKSADWRSPDTKTFVDLEKAVKDDDLDAAKKCFEQSGIELSHTLITKNHSLMHLANSPEMVKLLLDHKDVLRANLNTKDAEGKVENHSFDFIRQPEKLPGGKLKLFEMIVDDMINGKPCTWNQETLNLIARNWKYELLAYLLGRALSAGAEAAGRVQGDEDEDEEVVNGKKELAALKEEKRILDMVSKGEHTLREIFRVRRHFYSEMWGCFKLKDADGAFGRVDRRIKKIADKTGESIQYPIESLRDSGLGY